MTTMAIVLFAYSVSAYIFSGLTCYLSFLRQGNQDRKLSQFNLLLVSNLWIVALWPIWIVKESFGDDCNTDRAQEHLEASYYSLAQTEDESCRQENFNRN